MEKDIALGSVAEFKLNLEKGKVVISLGASKSVLDDVVSFESLNTAKMDGAAFLDLLFKEIEAKSPAGVVPIEETVKSLLKSAVMAIQ